jgi:hypothetical protein
MDGNSLLLCSFIYPKVAISLAKLFAAHCAFVYDEPWVGFRIGFIDLPNSILKALLRGYGRRSSIENGVSRK